MLSAFKMFNFAYRMCTKCVSIRVYSITWTQRVCKEKDSVDGKCLQMYSESGTYCTVYTVLACVPYYIVISIYSKVKVYPHPCKNFHLLQICKLVMDAGLLMKIVKNWKDKLNHNFRLGLRIFVEICFAWGLFMCVKTSEMYIYILVYEISCK